MQGHLHVLILIYMYSASLKLFDKVMHLCYVTC